jgi:hypothetical protein
MNPTVKYLINKYDLKYDDNSAMPVQIPNVTRLDLVRWCRELDFKIGVEVGVCTGEFSKLLVVGNEQMHLYGVDPYEPHNDYHDFVRQSTFDWIWQEADRRLTGFKRFSFIKKYSMDAVKDFEDNSIDFVYIDANHEEKFVYEDVAEWTKKVRPGGIVSGHDFVDLKTPKSEGERFKYGVKKALYKYTTDNNIHPWFVLGSRTTYQYQMREGIRSWAFVKN